MKRNPNERIFNESIEFAKLLDAPRSTYLQWKSGISNPTLEKSFEIAKKLNKKITEIWHFE
ncbi:helix-turn-helix transcriptional regulator [Clostridium uliginosum]|uniref:helix-turn-helix transcriptional regulator n=1 Tax=Clostridium uliginosum TaxID=119641 RepID=UPI003119AB75